LRIKTIIPNENISLRLLRNNVKRRMMRILEDYLENQESDNIISEEIRCRVVSYLLIASHSENVLFMLKLMKYLKKMEKKMIKKRKPKLGVSEV
jgi:hypothetical protein